MYNESDFNPFGRVGAEGDFYPFGIIREFVMTLSIVQRIKAGFALLLLLLLILGGISYLQTTGIHNKLKLVTEQATPLAMTTTRLREVLLLANRSIYGLLPVCKHVTAAGYRFDCSRISGLLSWAYARAIMGYSLVWS